MIRRRMMAMVVGGALTALCAPFAAAQCGSSEGGSCAKPRLQCAAGKVKSVNAKTRALVLTVGKDKDAKDVALKVCPKAKIQLDGKVAKIDAVKVGAAAKVCTVKSDKGELIAVAVTIGKGDCPNKAKCGGGSCGGAASGGCPHSK